MFGAAISEIVEAKDRSIWISTLGAGVLRFNPATREVMQYRHIATDPESLSSDTTRTLFVDHSGALWVGTDNGLDQFLPDTGAFVTYEGPFPMGQKIFQILEDRRHRLWVSGHGPLPVVTVLDEKRTYSMRFERDIDSPETASYPPGASNSLFEDRDGLLWFSTIGQGIRIFDPGREKFSRFGFAREATAQAEDRNGVLWIGTNKLGLYRIDQNRKIWSLYDSVKEVGTDRSLSLSEWITSLHVDRSQRLWVSLDVTGLIVIDPQTGRFEQVPLDASEASTIPQVSQILEDASGHLWLATWGGGLVRLNPNTRKVEQFTADEYTDNSVGSNYLYTLMFDPKRENVLWIGTGDSGLTRLDVSAKTFTRYPHDPKDPASIAHPAVSAIEDDGEGKLWLGTFGGGLIHFDPESSKMIHRFVSAEKHDGHTLPNDTIYAIFRDSRGNLWMSTNGSGLAVFDPRTRSFSSFRRDDGFIDHFFQRSAYRTRQGELVFGGDGGAVVFNPLTLKEENKPGQLQTVFTSFFLFNERVKLKQPIWRTDRIELSYKDAMVSFGFSALSFANPKRVRYSYMLEGLSNQWITTDEPRAHFTNLGGGNYVFKLRAATDYEFADAHHQLNIYVEPPPWKRWWAYLSYAAIVIGIAAAYVRYQAQRVDALKKENRLAAIERDIELTAAVQIGFLPKSNIAEATGFNLSGFYRAAEKCSGDWWWYELSEAQLSWILVGDVTGHGPGPAMVTAAAATAFRTHSRTNALCLEDRLRLLNEEVRTVAGGQYQMTMSVLEIDSSRGQFLFYSAGGLPAMKMDQNNRPKMLSCPGSPLGNESFSIGKLGGKLAPGDRFLLFTDGIPELTRASGKMLGMRGFSKIVEGTRNLPINTAVQSIITQADEAREGRTQEDDWTLAIVEWHGQQIS